MWVQSLGREDPLEEEMATHFSILSWEIPGTEEPGGLQSMGHKEPDTTEGLSIWTLEKTLMLRKIEGGRRRGQQRMRWLDGITDSMDMSLKTNVSYGLSRV